jgi:hypothetical protein
MGRTIIAILALILIVSTSAFAQPHVIADTLGGYMADDRICGRPMACGGSMHQIISIANPDLVQTEVRLVITQTVWVPLADPSVVFLNGIDTLFETVEANCLPGDLIDTIVIYLSTPEAPGMGLPVTQDTVAYFDIVTVAIPLEAEFTPVAFDSAGTPSGGGWYFDHATNSTWSGTKEYFFEPCLLNCIPAPECWDVHLVSDAFCEGFTYTFGVDLWDCGSASRAFFHIVEGPGEILTENQLYHATGYWSFTPTSDYADSIVMLGVVADIDYCGDSSFIQPGWEVCWITLHIGPNADGPSFVPDQNSDFVVTTGQTLQIQLLAEDADPCTDHRFSYYVDEGSPEPPGSIDELTGIFTYTGTEADTGTYIAHMAVTEGEYADTTAFTIYHYDSYTCGDMDHSGSTDISDLTWLVDYLFNYGPPPITVDAGDVNCTATVDISDLTYFVDWLFGDGPPPCDGGC